jgi:hypothetical protein
MGGEIIEAWIAARQIAGPAVLLKDPHLKSTTQGIDGLMIELDPGTSQVTRATICEDKCSENPRKMFRDEAEERMISMRPLLPDDGGKIAGESSAAIATGTMLIVSRGLADPAATNRRRHVNRRLALTPCRRATTATDAPGSKLSATIRRFRSVDQSRRPPTLPAKPLFPWKSNIYDSVHYPLVDTIAMHIPVVHAVPVG